VDNFHRKLPTAFGAFIESFESTPSSSPHPIPFLKTTSRYRYGFNKEERHPCYSRCPHRSEKIGEAVEAPKPADRQTNSSDVHIQDEEDSHPSSATQRRALATEPEPQHTSEQLHQMLFNLRKQMEDQQAEMNQLHDTATLKKDAAARTQTRLLKRVDTL